MLNNARGRGSLGNNLYLNVLSWLRVYDPIVGPRCFGVLVLSNPKFAGDPGTVIVGEGNLPEGFVEPVGPRYMYVKRHSWVSRFFLFL